MTISQFRPVEFSSFHTAADVADVVQCSAALKDTLIYCKYGAVLTVMVSSCDFRHLLSSFHLINAQWNEWVASCCVTDSVQLLFICSCVLMCRITLRLCILQTFITITKKCFITDTYCKDWKYNIYSSDLQSYKRVVKYLMSTCFLLMAPKTFHFNTCK